MMYMEEGLKDIARSIVIVGLATLSVFAFLASHGAIGAGWGLLAFLTWLL